jgi:carboxylesterase type B
MTNSITADVGEYGKVNGFVTGNVAEFRGVPFATIPARFRRAKLITSVPGGKVEATKYGPYPIQTPEDRLRAIDLFGEYVQTFFAEEKDLEMSEDCLNVNIVTPKEALGTKKLPVLAWIYGTFVM